MIEPENQPLRAAILVSHVGFLSWKAVSNLPKVMLHETIRNDDFERNTAMLEQCCNHSKQCRNSVVMLCLAKNRRCESSRVTSPLKAGDVC